MNFSLLLYLLLWQQHFQSLIIIIRIHLTSEHELQLHKVKTRPGEPSQCSSVSLIPCMAILFALTGCTYSALISHYYHNLWIIIFGARTWSFHLGNARRWQAYVCI